MEKERDLQTLTAQIEEAEQELKQLLASVKSGKTSKKELGPQFKELNFRLKNLLRQKHSAIHSKKVPLGADKEDSISSAKKSLGSICNRSIQPLFEGPIDIIGDIHGECGALCKLLDRLGYDGNGHHPEGRRLVFVGDLIDRGPNSPGVVRLVKHLIQQGNAQCILGNHELNILRGKHKHGNHWYYNEPEIIRKDEKAISFQVLADKAFRKEVWDFFQTLPVCLERDDCIVVHAMYHPESVETLRGFDGSPMQAFEMHAEKIKQRIKDDNITDQDEIELMAQNDNPVKVLTSGLEGRVAEKYFAGGKWRNLDRMKWWDKEEYQPDRLVVVGHYWRRFMKEVSENVPSDFSPVGDDMFPKYGPNELLGPKKKVMCVDFSAGVRYEERGMGLEEGSMGTRMGALRLPEMNMHLEDGRILACK